MRHHLSMPYQPRGASPEVGARLAGAGWTAEGNGIDWRCPVTGNVHSWLVADLLVRVPVVEGEASKAGRGPGKPNVDEATVASVRDLRAAGSNFEEIGRALGVSKSYAHQVHRRYVEGVARKKVLQVGVVN